MAKTCKLREGRISTLSIKEMLQVYPSWMMVISSWSLSGGGNACGGKLLVVNGHQLSLTVVAEYAYHHWR